MISRDDFIEAVELVVVFLSICIVLSVGLTMASAAMPEPNYDAWRAEQYHEYLVRKGHVDEN